MLPIRFEYVRNTLGDKVYVSILGEMKQHYTGETMYRVREEFTDGYINEYWVTTATMKAMLSKRVEG